MKVALDAGHGASRGRAFTGASANGLIEDELALDFVTRIGHHLRAAGHGTLCTRSDGRLIPLADRGRLARQAACDLFLSIHLNAGPRAAQGVEAFVAEGDERSRALAARLTQAIASRGMRDRGPKWDSRSQHSRLRVLRDTWRHMPAVLLEIGFVTSPHDAALLADRHLREAVAQSLAEGIMMTLAKR